MAVIKQTWLLQGHDLTWTQEAVVAGLDWLLVVGPNFNIDLFKVDIDILDMEDPEFCVLGQAGGDGLCTRTFDRIQVEDPEGLYDHAWLESHGFWARGFVRYETLTRFWHDALGAEFEAFKAVRARARQLTEA